MVPDMIAQPAASVLFVAAAALTPLAATAQTTEPTLEGKFEAARAGLVAEPERGLREGEWLEKAAAVRDGQDSRLVAASIWLQAEAYARLGARVEARREIRSALGIVQGLRPRIALEGDILRTRGDIASDEGNVSSALNDYQMAHLSKYRGRQRASPRFVEHRCLVSARIRL